MAGEAAEKQQSPSSVSRLPKPPGAGLVPPPPAAHKPPQLPIFIPPPGHKPRHRRRRSCCCCCCLWTIAFILLLLSVTTLAVVALHTWLRPSLPDISIQQISINKLDVTGNQIACNFDVFLSLRNHNDEIQLSYKGGNIRVSYDEAMVSLGSAMWPELEQPERNTTVMKVKVVSSGIPVDRFTGKIIAKEYKEKRLAVDVDVRMKVAAIVKGMNVGLVPVTASCTGIGVGSDDDGSSRKCKIYFNGLIVLN